MKRLVRLTLLIAVLLVSATVAIFLLFRPAEPNVVYWFNFAASVVLELLFSALFLWAKNKHLSVPFYIVSWTYLGLFILLSLSTMAIYFALVEPGIITLATKLTFPTTFANWTVDNVLKQLAAVFQNNETLGRSIYFSVFIVLTVIYVITMALLYHTDRNYTEQTEELRMRTQEATDYAAQITLLANKWQRISTEKNIAYTAKSNNRTALHLLANKMKFLTPNLLRSQQAQMALNDILEQCRQLIRQAEAADDAQPVADNIKSFVDDAVEQIDLLKTTTRS